MTSPESNLGAELFEGGKEVFSGESTYEYDNCR